MKKTALILVLFLSSCYRYPGYRCPDDVYYSSPIIRDQRQVYFPWSYSTLSPYYYYPSYSPYYYAPPPVRVPIPAPVLPQQPRRIISSPDNKKTEQKNNNNGNSPIRKF